MKFNYLVILIAIASLLLLYGVSLISQPPEVSLSALSDYNGQQVSVHGRVTMYRATTFGSQLITIRGEDADEGTAIIYIEGETSVEYGDKIQAVGQVQQYKNQWEIMVSNPKFVTIIEKWDNQEIPLWQLGENPERYLDTNVNVTGIISQKYPTSFQLTTPAQTHSLLVTCAPSTISSFSDGDTITVLGRFVYDPRLFQFTLKVTDNSHKIMKRRGILI